MLCDLSLQLKKVVGLFTLIFALTVEKWLISALKALATMEIRYDNFKYINIV